MSQLSYRYTFDEGVPFREIEESLLLAVLAAESLHGQSRVRMDAKYETDHRQRTCLVHADTEVGRDIARLFTGFLTREFGEAAFALERVGSETAAESQRRRMQEVPA